MKINICNTLNQLEKESIQHLISVCNKFDNTKNDIFLSNEYNIYAEMNCFFLYYDNENLLGFISIYADNKYIAEISSYVLPEYRKKGIFTSLYDNAKEELKKYNYATIQFKTEKSFIHSREIMNKYNGTLTSTEYLMEYDKTAEPLKHTLNENLMVRHAIESDLPSLIYVQVQAFEEPYESSENYVKQSFVNENTFFYSALINNEIVGNCSVDTTGRNNLIFGLCVSPKYQGKGIGRTLLSSVVEDLLNISSKNITLFVESENERALHLYTSCGFKIASEFQYYESKI